MIRVLPISTNCEKFGALPVQVRVVVGAVPTQKPVLAWQGIVHILGLAADPSATADLRLMQLTPSGVHLVAVLVPPGDMQARDLLALLDRQNGRG